MKDIHSIAYIIICKQKTLIAKHCCIDNDTAISQMNLKTCSTASIIFDKKKRVSENKKITVKHTHTHILKSNSLQSNGSHIIHIYASFK